MRPTARICTVLAAMLSLCLSSVAAAQSGTTRFVQPNGNDSTNDGTNWTSTGAWKTLGHALDMLNSGSDTFTEIWIATGGTGFAYTPDVSDPSISYQVQKPVAIYGGFQGPSTAYPSGETLIAQRIAGSKSVLSGSLGKGVYSFRIMLIDDRVHDPVLLDALDFQHGGDPSSPSGNVDGAAIKAYGGSVTPTTLTVSDCNFQSNTGWIDGGAIHTSNWSVIARRCEFDSNTVVGPPSSSGGLGTSGGPSHGGAIQLEGGGLTVVRCRFTANTAVNKNDAAQPVAGGAIYVIADGFDTVIVNCDFQSNSANAGGNTTGLGGAVWMQRAPGSTGTAYIGNCLFSINTAGDMGAGLYASRGCLASSCTFSRNVAGNYGGGAAFVRDSATGISFDVRNCIFWENEDSSGSTSFNDQIYIDSADSSYLHLRYSCVQGYSGSGTGNTVTDPQFIDPTSGNFRLRFCSPAVEAGSANLLPADVADVDENTSPTEPHPWDLDATARLKQTYLDMGAYEVAADCIGDINGDGFVNGADLGLLLGSWGNCTAAPCVGDLNCDGIANGADLGILLGQWGSCEPPEAELEGRTMFMSSGFYELTPEDLRQYLGVESVDQAIAMLSAMDFEAMRNLLESFFAGSGGYEY